MPAAQEHISEDHVILMLALKLIGRTGRYYLVKVLGLGEGYIKDRLRELKEMGLIRVTRSGSELNKDGLTYIDDYAFKVYGLISIRGIDLTKVFGKKYGFCIMGVLRSWMARLSIVEARDAGIRAGADAVLIMHSDCTKVDIPLTGLSLEQFDDALASEIKSSYPCNSYVVAVCGSSMYTAIRGLLSIAKLAMGGG